MSKKRFFMIILCVFSSIYAIETAEKIVLSPGKTVYSLENAFFSIDSIRPELQYRFIEDKLYGRLIFLENPKSNDTLTVYYKSSGIVAPKQTDLGIEKLMSWFPDDIEQSATKNDQVLNNVTTSGSISRKLQVSSSGQSTLSGGLDISLGGEIVPGMTIRGIISDNNAPFEAYSSTQSVQEVDKILIQIRSDFLDVNMGDIYINSAWNHWSRINRKLIGVKTMYRSKKYTADFFFGGAEGNFRRQEINGRDGDQGPYRLTGKNTNEAVIIVPQTESVFIDGTKLNKNQYTVYYSEAELVFSADVIISSESRIVAEFNYKNNYYPSTTFGMMNRWKPSDNIQMSISYTREKDDETNPGDVSLSGIDTDSLMSMISSNGNMVISTAIADTAGAYVKSGDIWVYVGSPQGDHTVYFYRENQNGGYVRRYTENGKMFYNYDPENPLSQYYPRRTVALPETRRQVTADLQLGDKTKHYLTAESAYSFYTPNNFNRDQNLSAPAVKWDAAVRPLEGIRIKTDGWYRSRRFESFGRLTAPEFERGLGFRSSDTLISYQSVFADIKSKSFQSQFGLQSAENVTRITRNKLFATGGMSAGKWKMNLNAFQLTDNKLLPYRSIKTDLQAPAGKKILLRISALSEYFQPLQSSGNAFRTEWGKTGLDLGENFNIDYTYRRDYDWRENDSTFTLYSQKHDMQTAFRQSFFKGKLKMNLSGTYRLDRRETAIEQYLLSRNRINLNISEWGLKSSGLLSVNRSSETEREAVFIYVGDGLGYYRLDEYGQFVADNLGNYIIRYEQTNNRIDKYISKTGTSLQWNRKIGNMAWSFRHTGNTEFQTPELLLYKKLAVNDPDTSCYLGRTNFRNEVKITDKSGENSLILFFSDRLNQNFQVSYSEQITLRRERTLKYERNLDKGKTDIYISYQSGIQNRYPLESYYTDTRRVKAGNESRLTFSPKLSLTQDVFYSYIETIFNQDSFNAHLFELKQDWIWNRIAGERLLCSLTLNRLISDYEKSLPYETANGLPAGWTFMGSLRYERQISRFISANVFLQYRKRGEQKDVLRANMEIKAYF